jgi:hypothetical protein
VRKSGGHPAHHGKGADACGGKGPAKKAGVHPPLPAEKFPDGADGAAGPPKPWRAETAMKKRPGRKLVFYLDVVPGPAHVNDPERWAAMMPLVVASLVASVSPNACQFKGKSGVSRQMTGQMLREKCLPGFPTVAPMTRAGQCTMTEFVAELEARALDAFRAGM